MRLISHSDPDKEYDPSVQKPSCENGKEYQRLLQVFNVVAEAVHRKDFTSQHTVNVDDVSILEDRFFGTSLERYLGSEGSIKEVRHDGAPDIAIVQNDFALAIDHFCFDCTKWTRKGSPLQAFLSDQGCWTKFASGVEYIELMRDRGINCSEKNYVANLSQMIQTKAKKANRYFEALDCYLVEEDRRKHKELWLFAEDILPIGSIDLVITEVLKKFNIVSNLSGMIYVRDKVPHIISNDINDIRFIFNSNE